MKFNSKKTVIDLLKPLPVHFHFTKRHIVFPFFGHSNKKVILFGTCPRKNKISFPIQFVSSLDTYQGKYSFSYDATERQEEITTKNSPSKKKEKVETSE